MPYLIFFILLSSVSFFDLSFIEKDIPVWCQVVSLVIILTSIVRDKSEAVLSPIFKKVIYILFFSVFFGLLFSVFFWKQPFFESLVVHRDLYFYSFYFYLVALKPHPDKVIKVLLISAVGFSLVCISQIFLYPIEIVSSKILLERNTVRIYMPGTILLYFGFIWSSYKAFYYRNSKYFLLFCFFASVLLLRGTRSEMIGNVVAVVVIILKSMQYQKKNIIYIASFILIGANLFGGVFEELNKVNQNTVNNFESDIRIEALSFFMSKFAPNELAYITGNGNSSENNNYGQIVKKLKNDNGYYQSDIGLVGDYSKFGIFFIVAFCILFYRVYKVELFPDDKFILYVFLAIFINTFINSEFTVISGIVPICCLLYLVDVYSYKYQYHNTNAKELEVDSK